MANITKLPVTGKIKTGGEKVIALNQQNIDLLKKGYTEDPAIKAANTAVSNKDLLSQSFGAPAGDVAVAPVQGEVVTNASEAEKTVSAESNSQPVQISAIPTNQNTTSLENDPVNMNMNSNITEEKKEDNATLDPLSGLESLIPNTNLNVTPIEGEKVEVAPKDEVIAMPTIEASGTEEKKEETAEVSPFKVTNAPNIFDQTTTSEASTEPKNEVKVEEPKVEVNVNPTNIFTAPEQQVSNEENKEIKMESVSNNAELSNDILQAEIALEKEAAELYDKLAQNTRKKIELLEQKKKTTNNVVEQNTVTEPSASILFNPNGTLNDNKVFEEIEGNPLKLVA